VLTLAWQTGAFCSYHRSPYHSRPLRAASRHPGRSKENAGLIGQLAKRPPEPRARKNKE